jgi:hypothetical protein
MLIGTFHLTGVDHVAAIAFDDVSRVYLSTLGHCVAVMKQGVLQQVAPLEEMYDQLPQQLRPPTKSGAGGWQKPGVRGDPRAAGTTLAQVYLFEASASSSRHQKEAGT